MPESIYLGLKPSDSENNFWLCLLFSIWIDFSILICIISDLMKYTVRQLNIRSTPQFGICVGYILVSLLALSVSKHTALYIETHEGYVQDHELFYHSSDLKRIHGHREERWRTLIRTQNLRLKGTFLCQCNAYKNTNPKTWIDDDSKYYRIFFIESLNESWSH